MREPELSFDLSIWRFKSPSGEEKEVTATYPITKEQAISALLKRGVDVSGWSSAKGAQEVKVSEPPPPPDGKMHLWRVTLTRTQSAEIEVEAETEDAAREFAKEDNGDADWDVDDLSVEDLEDLGPVPEPK